MLNVENIKILELQPISLNVMAGECVGVSGDSGCGKTRLLRAIADMDTHEGDIYLENESRNKFSGHAWRKKVSLLPAESQWWFDTVGEHFSEKMLANSSSLFNAFGFEPDVLNWQLSRCSSGEKQRLAIIRMLLNKPQVLLLDEPTANLDAENSRKVESLVADYLEDNNAMAIWVSHNQAQLKRVVTNSYYNLSANGLVVATG
jgi:ABC-type iron transport system FetAB ATPase subunit